MPAPRGEAAPPKTHADHRAEQALQAWQTAQLSLDAGDARGARRLLERAHRISPADAGIGFALASLRLTLGAPADAARLLERLSAEHDTREVWLMLAAARHGLRQEAAAAAALGHALSSHALADPAAVAPLADAVAQAADAPGWCGLRSDGTLEIRAGGPIEITADGIRLAADQPLPTRAGNVHVRRAGRPLIGSPVLLARIRRVEGLVESEDGGLIGWAWHPNDPDRDAVLSVRDAVGRHLLDVVAEDATMAGATALSRPRRFRVPAQLLHGTPPWHVSAADGAALPGSPLDPTLEWRAAQDAAAAAAARFPLTGRARPAGGFVSAPAAARGPAAAAVLAPQRPLAVVIPTYSGAAMTAECLTAVAATMPAGTALIVVDDATPEPALARLLDDWHAQGRIILLRHSTNRGFPASANAGMRAAAALTMEADIVLLNSDTLPGPGWLDRLREAVHGMPDIGTATPFSNDATLASYPNPAGGNPAPSGRALATLARQAATANPALTVEVPTAVGFCMYVRRECLAQIGLFREDLFAQGYGEENDFCIRARHFGWRHVVVPGAYVAHRGSASFGAGRTALLGRNLALLERLHPGYHALIAAFSAADPLAPARRRLDQLRWRAARRAEAVVMVTHDSGGGVERVVQQRAAACRAEGGRPILLRPVQVVAGLPGMAEAVAAELLYLPGRCRMDDDTGGFPNLTFAIPDELPMLARLLRGDRPIRLELHHLLGHHHAITRLAGLLAVPTEIRVHDYALFCPRITLVRDGRYCGEPEDARVCDACVADHGRNTEEAIPVAALRARSAGELAAAARVVVPSTDAAARLRRHFPAVTAEVEPHSAIAAPAAPAQPAAGRRRRVCVVGGIGTEKGYDVLLACGRDAAERGLPLEFVLVGHTPDDARLMQTGRVFVTGPYRDADVVGLIREQAAHLGFLPSIWPETWCFTLDHAWAAGLRMAAFDIGAPAARIRQDGRGWVLPLGLPAQAVNAALLALAPVAGA